MPEPENAIPLSMHGRSSTSALHEIKGICLRLLHLHLSVVCVSKFFGWWMCWRLCRIFIISAGSNENDFAIKAKCFRAFSTDYTTSGYAVRLFVWNFSVFERKLEEWRAAIVLIHWMQISWNASNRFILLPCASSVFYGLWALENLHVICFKSKIFSIYVKFAFFCSSNTVQPEPRYFPCIFLAAAALANTAACVVRVI